MLEKIFCKMVYHRKCMESIQHLVVDSDLTDSSIKKLVVLGPKREHTNNLFKRYVSTLWLNLDLFSIMGQRWPY